MCGIAGILADDALCYRDEALRMGVAMASRGPDDSGLEFISREGGLSLALVHRRLSILDLSPAGHQPMHDPQTGNSIVYNGEVYNFPQLRSELSAAGQRFTSNCDTEVILRGYAVWGADVVRRLRGMFAFAICDSARQRVLLARDRLGIKPLYYSFHPTERVRMVFASEIRALLASGLVARRLSPEGLSCYLLNGYVPDPLTILDGVHSLLPGWYMVVDAAGNVVEQKSYWTRGANGAPHRSADLSAESRNLRAVLEEVVSQHMISDVPLGAFLSGGIDSSVLVALMTRLSPGTVQTFSLVFEEPHLSEERYSRAVARRLGTAHREVRVTEPEFLNLMDDALTAIDQPTTDAINSYVISRKCRETGLTVAIAGTGGDELFGGYTSFQRVPRALSALCAYHRLPAGVRRPLYRLLRGLLGGSRSCLPSAGIRGKMAALLDLPPDVMAVYQLSRWVLLPELCASLLDRCEPASNWGVPQPLLDVIRSATESCSDLRERISVFEQSCYLSNQLLRDTDSVSMAVSLEVRVPFLDHVLVEALSHVHPDTRFMGPRPKQLLIEAVRDILPPEAYQRPKQGFVLPLGRWLLGPLASVVARTLGDDELVLGIGLNPLAVRAVQEDCRTAGEKVFYTRIWGLFVLADWCRRYGVRAA